MRMTLFVAAAVVLSACGTQKKKDPDVATKTGTAPLAPGEQPGEELPPIEDPDQQGQGQQQQQQGEPGDIPGHVPDRNPGQNPGTDPAQNQGTDPAQNPGTNPGQNPGANPGQNPGANPGQNPGANPGQNPGPGTSPQPLLQPVLGQYELVDYRDTKLRVGVGQTVETNVIIYSPWGDGAQLSPRFDRPLVYDAQTDMYTTVGYYYDAQRVLRNIELRLRLYDQNRMADMTLVTTPDVMPYVQPIPAWCGCGWVANGQQLFYQFRFLKLL